jgi:hypothetical protein
MRDSDGHDDDGGGGDDGDDDGKEGEFESANLNCSSNICAWKPNPKNKNKKWFL